MLLVACGVPGASTKNLEESLMIYRDLLEKMSEAEIFSSEIKIIE